MLAQNLNSIPATVTNEEMLAAENKALKKENQQLKTQLDTVNGKY